MDVVARVERANREQPDANALASPDGRKSVNKNERALRSTGATEVACMGRIR
jgi:hypothetical protein